MESGYQRDLSTLDTYYISMTSKPILSYMDSILLTNPKPAPSCSHEVDRNIAPETRDLHLSNENLRSLDNEYSSEGEDWLALAPWYIGGGAEVHSMA